MTRQEFQAEVERIAKGVEKRDRLPGNYMSWTDLATDLWPLVEQAGCPECLSSTMRCVSCGDVNYERDNCEKHR